MGKGPAENRGEPNWPGVYWADGCPTPGYGADVVVGVDHEGLAVRYVGREPLTPASRTTRVSPFGVVGFVLEGVGTLRHEGMSWPLSPGTVYWVPPQQCANRAPRPGSNFVIAIMMFFGSKTDELLSPLGAPYGTVELQRPEHVGAIYRVALDAMRYGSPYLVETCEQMLRALVHEIAFQKSEQERAGDAAFRVFRVCRGILASNFENIGSLAEVAEAAGVCQEHMNRVFARFCGRTPGQYLTGLRLSKAARLLQTTELSVAEIADSVGYSDPSRFSKVFSARFGMPPSVFGGRRQA